MNKFIQSYFFIIIPFLMPFSFSKVEAQVVESSSLQVDYVRWVSEFPSTADKSVKKGLFSRLGEFILGRKPAVVTQPVAVFAHNPDKYWVLDQKPNSISLIEKQKGTTLKLKLEQEEEVFSSLVDICALQDGTIIFTDSRLNQVFKIANQGKKAILLNDSLHLQQPTGIAFLRTKEEIWVLETKLHRIAILNANGELIKTIGSRGYTKGKFNFPTHIWIDKNGLVYIVDSMNFRVQIFNSDGEWVSMFGQLGDASGYFARPKGIATDSHGNIYVVDGLFHTVQLFNIKGELLYSFGNQGRGKGDFWMPNGIYIDSNDYIYIADSYNSRIQIFQLINHE